MKFMESEENDLLMWMDRLIAISFKFLAFEYIDGLLWDR